MTHLITLSAFLQDLFGGFADSLAKWVGLVSRRRVLTGSAIARACVLTWLDDPKATLEEIALGLGVSPQALQQRMGRRCQDFFRALIARTLARLSQARFAANSAGLLGHFKAVVVEDCTTVALPPSLAGLFPGCGGRRQGDGAAAVKILVRYELKTGTIRDLSFHPGRSSDAQLAARPADLPPGCLYLADMGFFGAARLGLLSRHCHWISRIPARTRVKAGDGPWQGLADWLAGLDSDAADVSGLLAEATGLPCRLVVLRCPAAVKAERLRRLRLQARRRGRVPGREQQVLCGWTCFATNVAATVLKTREVWLAYRLRWQIELLFKRCKGLAGWSLTHGRDGDRVLTELLAKVLGLLLAHWLSLLRGPALSRVSATKVLRAITRFARDIARRCAAARR